VSTNDLFGGAAHNSASDVPLIPVTPSRADDPRKAATEVAGPSTGELFRQYGGFVWRVLRRLGVPEEDADDIAQEVFVTVHRKLPSFEGRSSVRTWLYGIAVRVASDYRKRARTRREAPTKVETRPAIEPTQEDHVAEGQARALLDQILDELDEAKRAVFVLYEIEGLPMADVATAVGCPVQTAYSRLHSARRDVEAAVERLRQGRCR
jgi:RNA polymerase sigma-70 factor (ECF subfamily)